MASSCIFEQYEQLYLIRLAIVFLTSGAIHLNCFTGYGERKKNKPETDVSGCNLNFLPYYLARNVIRPFVRS